MEINAQKIECSRCGISLNNRPCIVIYPDNFCFCCSKREIEDSEQYCQDQYENELKAYNAKVSAYKKIHPTYGERMLWLGWGEIYFAIVGVCLFSFLGLLGGILLGRWVRQYFWDKSQEKLNSEFEQKNPYPVKTELDINNLIELDESRFDDLHDLTNYRRAILERDGHTCQKCELNKSESELEVHHVQPRSAGGPDHPTNLITLCLYCHDREAWFGHRRMFPTTFGREKN